jgi:hypothetical protein
MMTSTHDDKDDKSGKDTRGPRHVPMPGVSGFTVSKSISENSLWIDENPV